MCEQRTPGRHPECEVKPLLDRSDGDDLAPSFPVFACSPRSAEQSGFGSALLSHESASLRVSETQLREQLLSLPGQHHPFPGHWPAVHQITHFSSDHLSTMRLSAFFCSEVRFSCSLFR